MTLSDLDHKWIKIYATSAVLFDVLSSLVYHEVIFSVIYLDHPRPKVRDTILQATVSYEQNFKNWFYVFDSSTLDD